MGNGIEIRYQKSTNNVVTGQIKRNLRILNKGC